MQKTVTDYTILKSTRANYLVKDVSQVIESGWQPYGPMVAAVDMDGMGYEYFQPMVRYAKTTRDKFLDEKLELAITAMSSALMAAQDTPTSSPDDQKIREILGSAIEDIFNQEVAQ